jgi:hypothetical protein
LYHVIHDSLFGSSLSEDIERLTCTSFIGRLELLGEKYWAESMSRLHDEEKPADAVLSMREYLDHPAAVRIETENSDEILLKTEDFSAVSGAAEQTVVHGHFSLRLTGSYKLDIKFLTVHIRHTDNVFDIRREVTSRNTMTVYYSVLAEPSLLYQGEQKELITLSIPGSSVQYRIRIRPEEFENENHLDRCRTFEELKKHFDEKPSLAAECLNPSNHSYNDLIKWHRDNELNTWPLELIRNMPAGSDDECRAKQISFFRLLGLPGREDKLQSLPMEGAAAGSRKRGRKEYQNRDIRLLARLGGKEVKSVGISNRGLRGFRLFRQYFVIKNPFFFTEDSTGVSFYNGSGFIYHRYRLRRRKLGRNVPLYNQKDSLYNWRDDLEKALRLLRIHLFTSPNMNRVERRVQRKAIIRVCRRIMAHMPGSSLAVRLAIRIILLSGLKDTNTPLRKWQLLHLFPNWDVLDVRYAYKLLYELDVQKRVLNIENLPLLWYMGQTESNPMLMADLKNMILIRTVAFFRIMQRDLKLMQAEKPGMYELLWNKYRLILQDCMFSQGETEAVVLKLFSSAGKGELPFLFWRLLPQPSTAAVYLNYITEQNFRPEHFSDYQSILLTSEARYWEESPLRKLIMEYLPAVNKPEGMLIELLQSSDTKDYPYISLLNPALDDESFFIAINQCRTISSSLADECEKRLSSAERPWPMNAWIAAFRLTRLYYISADKLARQKNLQGRISLRFCYLDKDAGNPPIIIWPGTRSLCFLDKPDPYAVWVEPLCKFFPADRIDRLERKIKNSALKLLIDNAMAGKNGNLIGCLKALSTHSEDEISGIWSTIHPAIQKILSLSVRYYNDPEKPGEISCDSVSMDWTEVSRLALKLLRYYRPSGYTGMIRTMYRGMIPGKAEDIRIKLVDLLVRLDLSTLLDKDLDSKESNIWAQAVYFRNQYNKNNLSEIDFREYIAHNGLYHDKPNDILCSLCVSYLKETAMYYPYGQYLVHHWDYLSVEIVNDAEIVRYLMQTTDDYEFKLKQYLNKGEYSAVSIRTLAQAWRQYSRLTPVMEEYISRLIYRRRKNELAMIFDLLTYYYRKYPEKFLFLLELEYQWKHRSMDVPSEFEDLVKSKAYQEFLSWLQHENNLLLYV